MKVSAQYSVFSVYSKYGVGTLSSSVTAYNSSMGGVTASISSDRDINPFNPATYSNLRFVSIEGSASYDIKSIENTKNYNIVQNAIFNSILLGFSNGKKVGVSLGLIPYSFYNFNNIYKNELVIHNNQTVTNTVNQRGNGGLNNLYIGMSYNFFNIVNFGFNTSYLYGDLINNATIDLNDSISSKVLHIEERKTGTGFKLDLGLHSTIKLKENHLLNLGFVYTPNTDVYFNNSYRSGNYSNGVLIDTAQNYNLSSSKVSIPNSFNFGVGYKFKENLDIQTDILYQNWADNQNYSDRFRYSLGMEYSPRKKESIKLIDYFKYRFGFYYEQTYVKSNLKNISRIAVNLGTEIPIKYSPSGMILNFEMGIINPFENNLISEKFLRITLAFKFNAKWFQKIKID